MIPVGEPLDDRVNARQNLQMTLADMGQDLHMAWRAVLRQRRMVLLAVTTLAFGIAAVTTVFSIVDAAAFRSLPYPDADRIVAISEESSQRGGTFSQVRLAIVGELRAATRSFEAIGAFSEHRGVMELAGTAMPVTLTEIDPEILAILGAHAQRGRLPTPAEIRNEARVAVISDALWGTRFGGGADVLGARVRVGTDLFTIIGVMPPGFRFYERSDIWIPLIGRNVGADPDSGMRVSVIGRLRDHVTLQQARLEVRTIGQHLATTGLPREDGWRLVVRDEMVDRNTVA